MNQDCKHKYKIIEEYEGTKTNMFGGKTRSKVFILQCKVCGWVTQRWTELPYLIEKLSLEK